jgi:hypothetical protein
LRDAHECAEYRRGGEVRERRHEHDRQPDGEDRVTHDGARGPEPRGLAEDRRESHEPFVRRHFPALGRGAQLVNVGDLVQAQGLRRPLGQRNTLLFAVMQANEKRRRERHDP